MHVGCGPSRQPATRLNQGGRQPPTGVCVSECTRRAAERPRAHLRRDGDVYGPPIALNSLQTDLLLRRAALLRDEGWHGAGSDMP